MTAHSARNLLVTFLVAIWLTPVPARAQDNTETTRYVVTAPDLTRYTLPTSNSPEYGRFFRDDQVTIKDSVDTSDGPWALACADTECGWVQMEFLAPMPQDPPLDENPERDNIRVTIGEPPQFPTDGSTITKYAGKGEMVMSITDAPISCTTEVTLIVEFHPDGVVKGVMTGHLMNLLNCTESPSTKDFWLFGTWSGGPSGKVKIGTNDGQGASNPDWLTGTYNRLVINLSGKLVENNIGIEGETIVNAKLRRR